MSEAPMIAPCGFDCRECDILRAQSEPEAMAQVLGWFEKERNLKIRPEQIRCGGCSGERSVHWSADCKILRCCVDEKKFGSCASCPSMPCGLLQGLAGRGEGTPRHSSG